MSRALMHLHSAGPGPTNLYYMLDSSTDLNQVLKMNKPCICRKKNCSSLLAWYLIIFKSLGLKMCSSL